MLPCFMTAAVYWKSESIQFRTTPSRSLIALTLTIGSLVLAVIQFLLRPQSPWLLYAWISFLTALTWMFCLGRSEVSRHRAARPLLLAAVAGVSAVHVWMQFDLWRNLSFGYHDIGLFARALHNAAIGRGLWVDSLGRSLLGEHAFLASWALVPPVLLGIFPFHLLVTLSPICLNGTALIVAWYARKRLNSDLAGILSGLAWLLLPFHGRLAIAHGYGFHESYLAVPLLFAGFAVAKCGRPMLGAVILLSTMLIREDIALTVAAWGAYQLMVSKRRALGATVILSAVAYFLVAIYIIVPHYRGAPYPHIGFHFSNVGITSTAALLTNLSFLVTLLLPTAFLPLRAWRFSLIALPAILETLLTTNPELHNIGFQYYVPAIPVLFFAAIESWVEMRHRGAADPVRQNSANAMRPGWSLLVAAALCHAFFGIGPLTNNPTEPFAAPALVADSAQVARVRELIPPSASVTASYRIAAHFLDADRLYTTADERLGDFVIVHEADVIDEHLPRAALSRAIRTGTYQPIFADYSLVVLSKQKEQSPLAREIVLTELPSEMASRRIDLGEGVELVGMSVKPTGPSSRATVRLVWRCTGPISEDYRFGLVSGETRWGPFRFARGAIPTDAWTPGILYGDQITIEVAPVMELNPAAFQPVLLR
ncbi:MAG: hypothetical protein AMXMBFR20_17230 [Planctomycetia bacterium]